MNMLLKGSALGFAAPLLLNGAVKAVGPPIPPSSTNPNSNSATTLVVPVYSASLSFSFPTNPNPPPDQARSLAKPLFVAQVPSQIDQGDKQPSNSPLVTPPNRRYDAGQIADLEMQIRAIKQTIEKQMQQNRDKFQEFLRNRQQQQKAN